MALCGVQPRGARVSRALRGERPSIIHAHDWQTGLVPVYQKMHFSPDPIVGGVPAVFTIHNLAFQGIFPPRILPAIGLGWDVLDVEALEFWGHISYLKGGINFSERITTVSPTYAREILDAGVRLRLRRRARAPRGRPRRHPQRHRRRAMESGERIAFVPATFYARTISSGKATAQARRCSRPPVCATTLTRWRGRSSA